MLSVMARTHGMRRTVEYKTWIGMRQRCRNPRNKNFRNYGGHGIKVCFKSFEEFYTEVGPKPSPDHSIDRFPDNNGHYEKGNIRWATWSQQNANKRRRTHCPRGHPLPD
jgi:hypothetical protein